MIRNSARTLLGALAILGTSDVRAQSAPEDCNALLVQQVVTENRSSAAYYSWLSLVTESNYSQAKASASAFGITAGGLFDGSFSQFNEKRRSLLRRESYIASQIEASSLYRSYLTESQLAAYRACRLRSGSWLELTAANVDATGATMVLRWFPQRGVGALSDVKISVGPTASINDASVTNGLPRFEGERSFVLTRKDTTQAIRVTAIGHLGAAKASYTDHFYLPGTTLTPTMPARMIIDMSGQILGSTGYWGGGRHSAFFPCQKSSSEMELLVLAKSEGPRKWRTSYRNLPCMTDPAMCDGHEEWCTTTTITRGCWVSRAYVSWYESFVREKDLPYSRESLCVAN